MKSYLTNDIKSNIDNTLEMSSICRGEWCRSLESEVDLLENELDRVARKSNLFIDDASVEKMSNKLRKAYRNLGPDIHI